MITILNYIYLIIYSIISFLLISLFKEKLLLLIPIFFIIAKISYKLLFDLKQKKNLKDNYLNIISLILICITSVISIINRPIVDTLILICSSLVSIYTIYMYNKKKKSTYSANYTMFLSSILFSFYILLTNNLNFIITPMLLTMLLLTLELKNKRNITYLVIPVIYTILSIIYVLTTKVINIVEIDKIFFISIVITLIINNLYKTIIKTNETNKIDLLNCLLIIIIYVFKLYYLSYMLIPFVIIDLTINNKTKIKLFDNNSTKESEKISVIIPNYNYANYLFDRINTVINQTIKVDEIIILDDASTDNSDEIINEIIKTYKEYDIKYIKNEQNSKNVFEQWKKGIEEAKNELIWICEADDLCSNYFLEEVLKPMKDKKVLISYSESVAIDKDNNILFEDFRNWNSTTNSNRWNKNYIKDGIDEIKEQMIHNNSINNVSGVLFRKLKNIDYNQILNEAKKYKLSGDWYFYNELLKCGKIAYNSKSLNYHRIHAKSVTSTTKDEEKEKETKKIRDNVQKYLDEHIKI